ncbi:Hypothetical predicted protein, partial [Marmota monax]
MVAKVSKDGGDCFQSWGSKGKPCGGIGWPVQRCSAVACGAMAGGYLEALSTVPRRLPHGDYGSSCSVPKSTWQG